MKDSSAEIERKDYQQARALRRRERIDYWRARFAPLVVKPSPPPAPQKRTAPVLVPSTDMVPISFEGRWRSRRERAAELRERMAAFGAIYNAGWLVRDAYFGPTQRSEQMVMRFVAVLLQEMRTCNDFEALIYAAADTLTCSRHGVPWEE